VDTRVTPENGLRRIEINEAFAVIVVAVIGELGLPDKIGHCPTSGGQYDRARMFCPQLAYVLRAEPLMHFAMTRPRVMILKPVSLPSTVRPDLRSSAVRPDSSAQQR
jgi:hypothetical protein